MNKIILLRPKPKLEVSLREIDFKVIDTSDSKNEGIYLYMRLESVEFKKQKINWFVSVASYAFGIITESGMGEKYKDQAYLKLNLKDKTIKLWLIKSDIEKAQELKKKLDQKITLSKPTSQNTETNPLL